MKRKKDGSMGFDMSETTLGKELRGLRADRPLREVSEGTGITMATLSRIETGLIALPTRETLAALSRYYRRPIQYFATLAYCGATAPIETDDPASKDELVHAV